MNEQEWNRQLDDIRSLLGSDTALCVRLVLLITEDDGPTEPVEFVREAVRAHADILSDEKEHERKNGEHTHGNGDGDGDGPQEPEEADQRPTPAVTSPAKAAPKGTKSTKPKTAKTKPKTKTTPAKAKKKLPHNVLHAGSDPEEVKSAILAVIHADPMDAEYPVIDLAKPIDYVDRNGVVSGRALRLRLDALGVPYRTYTVGKNEEIVRRRYRKEEIVSHFGSPERG